MKARLFSICLALCLFASTHYITARTLLFTYTSPTVIFAYNNHPIQFIISRDFQEKARKSVVGLSQTTTITLTDDGPSVLRPYIITSYVPPFRGQQLPYPVFFPSPGSGRVTISVDGEEPNDVLMVINPFEGLEAGPMGCGFIF